MRWRVKFRDAFRYWLYRRGYQLERSGAVDVRQRGNDPRSFNYHRGAVLVDADTEAGRGLENFSLSANGLHPFVRATVAATSAGDEAEERAAIRDTLARYYELVRPETADQWLGLAGGVPQLTTEPPWSAPLPWSARSIVETQQWRHAIAKRENSRSRSTSTTWHATGPVDAEKLLIETGRIHALIASIRSRGLLAFDGPSHGMTAIALLRDDREMRWAIDAGQHRAAVASGLGYTRLPVWFVQIVDRRDVDVWPNVLSGLYPPDTALALFDRIFEGVASPAHRAWTETVSSTG